MGLLRSIDLFTDMDRTDLKRLSAAMKPRSISPGDQLAKSDVSHDVFYVVAEGELDVTDVSFGSTKFVDSKLTKGSYFGERVLASDEPQSANIVATAAGMVFYIDKRTFEKVMGKFSRVILRAQDKILEEVDLLQGAKLSSMQFEDLADYIIEEEFKADEMIFSDEEETEAAMYIVRQGSVKLTGAGIDRTIKPGEYFGESLLLLHTREKSKETLTPRFSAQALEHCFVGVLHLYSCRLVFDTEQIPDLDGENMFYLDKMTLHDSDDEAMFGSVPSSLARETTKQWLKNTSSDLLRSAVKTNVQLDDLNKLTVLGEGQFGKVWLVSANLPGTLGIQLFALKCQQREDDSRGESVDFIRREIDLLRICDHPFIITFVHEYEDPSQIYILMRLVYGGELFDVLHYQDEDGKWSSGIPEDHAKFYAMMIADTLEYMHRKSLVYRDLKPENVLIDREGYPVICDFGFAKFVEDMTYTMCGTPNYLSPEVIMQKGHNFSTDHWALGVLIYEMVAGENPFYYQGMPQMELFELILTDSFYPLPDEVSDDCFDVVDGLLVKDPTQRLGALAGRGKDIIHKAWFKDLDLVDMRQKKHRAPFIPRNEELDEHINKLPPPPALPTDRHSTSLSALPIPAPPPTFATFTEGSTVKFGNVRKKRLGSLIDDADSD